MKILIVENAPAAGERWEDEAASDRGVEKAAAAVAQALRGNGHSVRRTSVTKNPSSLLTAVRRFNPDVAVNFCETVEGDSALEPAPTYLLRWLGTSFTGCQPETLALLVDKVRTKFLFQGLGVPTPPFRSLLNPADLEGWNDWPALLKPVTEDASLGIDSGSVVSDFPAAKKRFLLLKERFGGPVLIEAYIEGREINAALLETPSGPVTALNEIDFSAVPAGRPHILTYAAKWAEESDEFLSTPVKAPARLAPDLDRRVRGIAVRLFHALGIRGYARVDIRIDRLNRPFVLEVNPNPDLSPDAGFAKSLGEFGLSYSECVENLVRVASMKRTGGSR